MKKLLFMAIAALALTSCTAGEIEEGKIEYADDIAALKECGSDCFQEEDWTGSVSIDADGRYTYEEGNAAAVQVLTEIMPSGSCDDLIRTLEIIIFVPQGDWNNAGDKIYGTVDVVQPPQQVYTADDWCGILTVNANGEVIPAGEPCDPSSNYAVINLENITAPNFPLTNEAVLRLVVATGEVPEGYCNAGELIEVSNYAWQPPAN